MDDISNMSSEARPRSLPAVVVKAGLTRGRCACKTGLKGRPPLDLQGERVTVTDMGEPHPPIGCMKKCMLFKCILVKGFMYVLCLIR